MKVMSYRGSILTGLMLSVTIVVQADWPQWRGPKRDGDAQEKGLLQSWPAGGPKLVWQLKGLGKGYSSVSVADGRIFTMGDKDGSSFVLAFNEADGKPLWAAKVGKEGAPGGYAGPRC